MSSLPPNIQRQGAQMNNRYVETVSQKDREFEELLCLAYLFTHSVDDEFPDEPEIPQAGVADLIQNYYLN
jgi:hypothetical protein